MAVVEDLDAANGRQGEIGSCPNFEISVADLRPAAFNDVVYNCIDPDDPSLDELAGLMGRQGQLEPIVITWDNVILSGHRRYAVARRLQWQTLQARYHEIYSTDPDFETLLVSYNSQRDKSPDVRIREAIVLADPENAYENLVSEREKACRIKADRLILGDKKGRPKISAAKKPFLDAIKKILEELRQYWKLTDRRIHYALLNDPPLIHTGKPESRYKNDRASWKAVCDLLTRARLAGKIPFEAIGDETRPVVTWDVHRNVTPFFKTQVEEFCTRYYRDLMQSQPDHIEIVGEKMTVEGIIKKVAGKYCIPYTIGRGYSSLPPRKDMHDRFKRSGKERLVILFLNDLDPEGENIPETFAKSMRDDFGVSNIFPVKVALNPRQVEELGLPPNADAKKKSSRYKKFAAKFGPAAYELEAAPPGQMETWLDEDIRKVINIDRYNEQVELEKKDAITIKAYREAGMDFLKTLRLP